MGHESSGFAAGFLPRGRPPRRQWFGRSAACLAALAAWRAAPLQARPPLGGPLIDAPFALGVASGAPLEDSVVIWTRLCTDPASPH